MIFCEYLNSEVKKKYITNFLKHLYFSETYFWQYPEQLWGKQRHLERKERQFACTNPNCKKTFKNRSDCNYHIKNLCNKPPRYKCGHCNYKSHSTTNIKSHSLVKHKDLYINIMRS